MKRLFCLAFLFLSGCNPTPIINDGSSTLVRRVADTSVMSVYIVTVEGHDYIVTSTMHGVSMCPKTP